MLPNSSARTSPRTIAPPLSCDTHLHIYEPGFAHQEPFVTDAGVAQYRMIQALLGTRRAVVVQPRIYGIDNRATLHAIAALGRADARGVAVVSPEIADAELLALHEGGIRGIRFSLHAPNAQSGGFEAVERLAGCVHQLGWHVQLHWTADQIVRQRALLERLPAAMVFDHLARLPLPQGVSHPAFDIVRRLLESGRAWLKLSGAYLETREGRNGYGDIDPVARAWIDAAPARLVWGSDWPHVTEPLDKPDDAELLDLLARWCNDDTLLERILVGNPARLYGFEDE